MPQNQSGYLITLRSVDGGDLGVYTSFSGGEVTFGTVSDRQPGQRFPTASSGDATIGEITIGRRVRPGRDTDEYRRAILKHGGRENSLLCNKRAIDADGNPKEAGDTYLCSLVGVTPTPADNNSENEAAVFEVRLQPSNLA